MRPLQFITVIIKPCLQHDSVARVYWRQHFSFTVRRTTIAECVCVCVCRSLRANRQHTERLGANRPVHGPRHARRTLRQLGRCRAG